MSIFTVASNIITPTITQAKIADGIKAAMINAGFPGHFDDYSATNRNLLYEVVGDSGKTFGRFYLLINITSTLVVNTSVMTTWNAVNHTGNGQSQVQASTAFTSGSNITINSFNGGSECKFIQMVQGSNVVPIGYIRPTSKAAWWDENTYPYGFAFTGGLHGTLRTSTLNPFSNDSYTTSLNDLLMSGGNPITSHRDVLGGVIVYSQSNNGICGRTSDDLAACAATGLSRYSVLQPQGTNQQYTIINPAAGGFCVRTT